MKTNLSFPFSIIEIICCCRPACGQLGPRAEMIKLLLLGGRITGLCAAIFAHTQLSSMRAYASRVHHLPFARCTNGTRIVFFFNDIRAIVVLSNKTFFVRLTQSRCSVRSMIVCARGWIAQNAYELRSGSSSSNGDASHILYFITK